MPLREARHGGDAPSLLCVCNYPANTGYAWDFIESLYARVATRLAAEGLQTYVSYPRIDTPPRTLEASPASPVVLDATLGSGSSVRATLQFVRRHGVRVFYCTDGAAWSPVYPLLRLAGVRTVIVHSHWSGPHEAPKGVRRAIKWSLSRLCPADRIVTVSDYVAAHHRIAGMFPPDRIVRVWNGMDVSPAEPDGGARPLHSALNLPGDARVIACACRASKQKGVPVLLEAFRRLLDRWPTHEPKPVLVYMGDGPEFAEIRRLRDASPVKDGIFLTGYRPDAASLLAGADVCALPSIGADALPLAVMHPMALGRPVVASAVGGVPEMILDGETGLLVPPGDEEALSRAIGRVLADPSLAASLGRAARNRIATCFTPAGQIDALTHIVRQGFGGEGPGPGQRVVVAAGASDRFAARTDARKH